jgi:hypothetical protein
MFAVLLIHVTEKIAMRTLHIRAKSFGVPLLAAVSAMVGRTAVISMRTLAKVPARFAHRNIAAAKYLLGIIVFIVVIFVVVIMNIAIGIVVIITHVSSGSRSLVVISSVELIAFVIAIVGLLSPSVAMGASL